MAKTLLQIRQTGKTESNRYNRTHWKIWWVCFIQTQVRHQCRSLKSLMATKRNLGAGSRRRLSQSASTGLTCTVASCPCRARSGHNLPRATLRSICLTTASIRREDPWSLMKRKKMTCPTSYLSTKTLNHNNSNNSTSNPSLSTLSQTPTSWSKSREVQFDSTGPSHRPKAGSKT